MLYLLRNSSDPKITGLKKGGTQAFVQYKESTDYFKYIRPTNETDLINSFFNEIPLKFENINLYKNTKLTDNLSLAEGVLNGLLISEKLYNIIYHITDFHLLNVFEIKNIKYYYIKVKPIPLEKYIFNRCCFYRGTPVLKNFGKIEYIDIYNITDYLKKKNNYYNLQVESIHVIEDVTQNIIFDSLSRNFFISDYLRSIILNNNITGFNILDATVYEPKISSS